MQVLEGTKVLIKQQLYSACSSTPSTSSSNSPCPSASDHPTPPPSQPIPLQPTAPAGWTAERLPMPDLPISDPTANTLYDFSGVYYVPPNELPLNVGDKPNIYNLSMSDDRLDEMPLYDPFSNIQALANGSNGPTVIAIPEYPTFSSNVARQPQEIVRNEDIHMHTSLIADATPHPHATRVNGETNAHANGFPGNGFMGSNPPADQSSWDSFLQELGIASST